MHIRSTFTATKRQHKTSQIRKPTCKYRCMASLVHAKLKHTLTQKESPQTRRLSENDQNFQTKSTIVGDHAQPKNQLTITFTVYSTTVSNNGCAFFDHKIIKKKSKHLRIRDEPVTGPPLRNASFLMSRNCEP